ncbi:MAG: hypothetical protein J6R68_03700 [Clostridia bacterium]|nr:hypothetical protein [Clostridia bacterium]MBO7289772.1 hypothetical protein [Clostridia bacterium]
MLSRLVLKSTSGVFDEETRWYELDGISIMVCISYGFLFMENVNKKIENKNVISVCFSNENKPISHEIITLCLKFFGFDFKKEMYVKCIPFMDYDDMLKIDCYCFEQLLEKSK